MKGSLRRKFRNYIRENRVFIPRKKNMHIFTALALAVEETLEWASMKTDQVKHLRPAAEIAPLLVDNTPNLFKAYSDNEDKYFSNPKDDFDHEYS